MLLGKKTGPNIQSDWAVILNRAPTDFQRHRAGDLLIDVFHLSSDEAGELMANTPIVLLDQISLETAEKIREHFSKAGVDCSATNDILQKRKCFRAIWPQTPDLSRFLESSPKNSPEEELTSSFQLTDESETIHSKSKDEDELKQLTFELQRENETLKRQLERSEQTTKVKTKTESDFQFQIKQFQSEESRLQEAIKRLRDENALLTTRTKDLEQQIGRSRQEKLTTLEGPAKIELAELRVQLEHLRSEYLRTQNTLRSAQSEAKQFQHEWTQTQKTLSQARAECEDLKRMLDEAQMNCVQLKEEVDRAHCDVDERLREQSAELEEWKRKAGDWSAGYSKVIKENEFLRAHQTEELETLRVRNRELGEQLEQVQRQNREFVQQLEQQKLIQKRTRAAHDLSEKEVRLKELVQKQQSLEQEIRSREDDMKNILRAQEEAEREIVKLKQTQKYMLEQTKIKEKTRFSHQRGAPLNAPPPPEDPGAFEPADEI